MLEKYYLSDMPSDLPRADGVKYLSSVDDLINLSSALVYCDSETLTKLIRKYDTQGTIHLGCRGILPNLMYKAPVLRFSDNYLMCSNGWNTITYQRFLEFQPKEPLKLPETHYVNIQKLSDKEAVKIFKEQMKTLAKNPEMLGIDFETNDFPDSADFFPLGLSICDKENSYYYDFDCYLDNKDTRPLFYEALRQFVEKNTHRLWAFNVSFEIRCFYFMYHQFFKLQDTRAMCIVDGMKSNLKYGAQYYLEVASWDDSVDEEQRLLNESFEIPVDQFEYEYSLGMNSQFSYVQKLFEMNKDNPDFIPRYEKYHGSAWACSNQKTVGKYCCYDSVMDIHICEKIKNYTHVDHHYSEECYLVYLFNQYLSAIIDMSGIFVEPRLLEEERDTYNRIYFNTNIWLNKEMVKFKISYLKKHCNDRIKIELNDKLAYLVDELNSYIFIQADRSKLGKEFAKLVRNNPEAFYKLVPNHADELQYIVTSWCDDEEFAKVSRGRKLFKTIGDFLYEEWDLNSLFRKYNEEQLRQTNCNKKAVDNLPYTEEELRAHLSDKKAKDWIKSHDKPLQYYINQYIFDMNELHDAEAIENSLELRRYEAIYQRMLPHFTNRTIYDPIDESLKWMYIFEFNSPIIKNLAGTLLQDYCQDSYATFAGFTEFCKEKNKPEWYTKAMYFKYDAQMREKYPDLKEIPEYYPYYYDKVPKFEDKVITDRKTGEQRTVRIATDEFFDEELMWSLKTPPAMTKGFPPCNIPLEHQMNPWENEDDTEHLERLDEEFDVPIFNCHKFIGIYKLNRIVTKMLSTSVASLDNDGFNVKLLDHSRGLKINKEKIPYDGKKLTKYYIKAMANSTISGRWGSNVHSVLAPTEDTRIALQTKMGTHFLLARNEEQENNNPEDVYKIDGYNFRSSDYVKVSSGEMKQVKDLTETDEFDQVWLQNMIELDKQKTGDVYWDYSDICYSQNL